MLRGEIPEFNVSSASRAERFIPSNLFDMMLTRPVDKRCRLSINRQHWQYLSLLDEQSSCQDDLQITTVATVAAFEKNSSYAWRKLWSFGGNHDGVCRATARSS
jgi:hypothetical protein